MTYEEFCTKVAPVVLELETEARHSSKEAIDSMALEFRNKVKDRDEFCKEFVETIIRIVVASYEKGRCNGGACHE